MSLDIYEKILKILPNNILEINRENKLKLMSDIETNRDTHEMVFAIIRKYQISHNTNTKTLPYQCRWLKTKSGYKFELDNLPNRLVYILIKYYEMIDE